MLEWYSVYILDSREAVLLHNVQVAVVYLSPQPPGPTKPSTDTRVYQLGLVADKSTQTLWLPITL